MRHEAVDDGDGAGELAAAGEQRETAIKEEVGDEVKRKKQTVPPRRKTTRRPSASSASGSSDCSCSDSDSRSSCSTCSSNSSSDSRKRRRRHGRRRRATREDEKTGKEKTRKEGQLNSAPKEASGDGVSCDLFEGWDQSDKEEQRKDGDAGADADKLEGKQSSEVVGAVAADSTDVDRRNGLETSDGVGSAEVDKGRHAVEPRNSEVQESFDSGSGGARKHSGSSLESAKINGELFTETFRVFSNDARDDDGNRSEDVRDHVKDDEQTGGGDAANGSRREGGEHVAGRDAERDENTADDRQKTSDVQVDTNKSADVEGTLVMCCSRSKTF